jgi:hypothetical protein
LADLIIPLPATILVNLAAEATLVERSAAELLAEELQKTSKSQVSIHTGTVTPNTPLVISLRMVQRDREAEEIVRDRSLPPEGFIISTYQSPQGTSVHLVGGDGRGVLYAVDELLDRYRPAEQMFVLPQDFKDAPDAIWRGATFVGHDDLFGPAGSEAAQAKLAHYQNIIRYLGRHRQNTVILFAGWPSNLSPLLTWHEFPRLYDANRLKDVEARRARFRALIDTAHAYGLDAYLCTTEFTFDRALLATCPEIKGILPPSWSSGLFSYLDKSGFTPICPSKPLTWEWYRAKVREIFQTFPDLAGYELWLAESFSDVTTCHCEECRKLTPADKIALIIEKTLEAMNSVAPGKTLLLRTFLSPRGALEPEFFGPLKGKLPEQVVVNCKAQWGDMAYLNDPHPFIGWLNNGRECAEFDLMGEYRGGGSGAMISCIPEYISERTKLYAARGCRRFFARHVEFFDRFEGLQQVNWEAYFRCSWHFDTPVDQIWQDWTTRTFGAELAPAMTELLGATDELVNKTLYARRACINRHYWVFPDTLTGFRYFAVDNSARCMADGVSRIEPTPENIEKIIAEKEEAVQLMRRLREQLAALEGRLEPRYYQMLDRVFKRSQLIVNIYRPLTEALWRYMLWERTISEFQRDAMRPTILAAIDRTEEAINEAEKQDPFHERMALGSEAFGGTPVVDYNRARQLIEEVRGNFTYTVSAGKWQAVTVRPYTSGWSIWRMYCLDADRKIRELLG